MSGYIGLSRSVRSKKAIDNFEVPISFFKKEFILKFLEEFKENYSEKYSANDLDFLEKINISKWKFVAKDIVGASSWHHTSKFYNKTNHYDLNEVAIKLIELKNDLDTIYKNHLQKDNKANANNNFKYGVIKVNIWGGTRNNAKIVGIDKKSGIIINNWLYYLCSDKVFKYKTNANKVVSLHQFNSYQDLVKKHPEYNNTEKEFNELIEKVISK